MLFIFISAFVSALASLHLPPPDLALYLLPPSVPIHAVYFSFIPLQFPIFIHSPCISLSLHPLSYFLPPINLFPVILLFLLLHSICLTVLSYLSFYGLLYHSSSSHHSLLFLLLILPSCLSSFFHFLLCLPIPPLLYSSQSHLADVTHYIYLPSIPFSFRPSHLLLVSLYPLLPLAVSLASSFFAIPFLFYPSSFFPLLLTIFPSFPCSLPLPFLCHGGHIFNYSVIISPTGHFQLH